MKKSKLAAALGFACALSFGGLATTVPIFAGEGDILVADFEGTDYGNWTVEGTAFGPGPARGTIPGQMNVAGYEGSGLVNTFFNGDGSTGKLTSPEFEIAKPFINFLIGGGGHAGTRFELLVDGQVVRIERGPNTQPGGSEELDWATWDVSDLVGKKCRFRIVDEETGGWGHINVDHIVFSDKKIAGTAYERELVIENRYLVVPIDQDGPKRWVRVEVDGIVQREFEASVMREGVKKTSEDFSACIDMGPWVGKKLKFIVEKISEDAKFVPLTFSNDPFANAPAYDEKYRPQFHFSPRTGWTNDPNGLVYHDGVYELFYQHNPFGTGWGNMTWGHAVSPDLLHWEEQGDAIYADRLGTIFSGSGAIDHKNTTGFQKDPNGSAPLVFLYTQNGPNMRYGEPASQSLAYSLDGGKTLQVYEGNPVLPHIVGGNRDPKFFWYEPKQYWVTALYLDGEDYALFSSKDLKSWEMLCRIDNLGCSECPDIFELPVDGDESNKLWVFWGGNGKYLLGTFDGVTFTKQTDPLDAKWGGNDYAAQTYSDTPGRRIQLSWMSGGQYPGMPFNQQYAVPRELTLRTTPEGVRLCINPVVELAALREAEVKLAKTNNAQGAVYASENDAELELLDAEIVLTPGDAKLIKIALRGQVYVLDIENGKLKRNDIAAPLAVVDGKIKLRIVLDRTSIEIFANDGLSQIACCFVPEDKNDAPAFTASVDCVDSVKLWKMKSVWK